MWILLVKLKLLISMVIQVDTQLRFILNTLNNQTHQHRRHRQLGILHQDIHMKTRQGKSQRSSR